eukprot:1925549-Pyramimonas_sp.AAC.1
MAKSGQPSFLEPSGSLRGHLGDILGQHPGARPESRLWLGSDFEGPGGLPRIFVDQTRESMSKCPTLQISWRPPVGPRRAVLGHRPP